MHFIRNQYSVQLKILDLSAYKILQNNVNYNPVLFAHLLIINGSSSSFLRNVKWNTYFKSTERCNSCTQKYNVRGCIQKFPDWPPGARTANGTTLCQ